MTAPSTLDTYGWTAQTRDMTAFLGSNQITQAPSPQTVASIPLPSTPLANAVLSYARKELSEETFNHSMRVYYYGRAIQNHLQPTHLLPVSAETYLLTCLLHDIGTTDKNTSATHMSFEFYGGYLALELLSKDLHAPVAQAESVAEAVIRHQDVGGIGTISSVGLLIQLATVFDNMGQNPSLVHADTIADVVRAYPRRKWSVCFGATIRRENRLKPWAHTTAMGEEAFPGGVEGNELMAPYDG